MYAEALMGLQASQRTEQAISIGAYAGDWNILGACILLGKMAICDCLTIAIGIMRRLLSNSRELR
jgi:hypothetical protein